MAQITGAVNLTGMIAPTDTTDVYPTHSSEYGKGGYREVADITARDAISTDRRVDGMLVTTQDTGKIYRLGSGLTNNDWSEVSMPDTTDTLTEGSTNLYYTDARVGSYLTSNSYVTETYVDTAINNVIDQAPGTLDTLNELAAALGDDPNFATTVTSVIATKANSADVYTQTQIDTALSGKVSLSGDTMTGALTLSGAPVNALHAATKSYVDSSVNSVSSTVTNLTTDDVAEGSINLYYTDARVDSRIPTNLSDFINDVGYITSETDSQTLTFSSPNLSISNGNSVDLSVLLDNTNLPRITSAGFNTTNGILTLTRDDATTVTVDLDGRYLESFTETDTLHSVTTRGNTTTNNITVNDLTVNGNLTVEGTTTTINATELAIEDNLIYLNEGSTVTNPDLGWVGNYNDGTYAHAGFFRDSTDGVFKLFDGYTPEPGQSIDVTHTSFGFADLYVDNLLINSAPTSNNHAVTKSYVDNVVSSTTGALTTDDIPEGTSNLYYSDNRVRGAISASGDLAYNSLTGVISYSRPTLVSQFTNDSGYITASSTETLTNKSGNISQWTNDVGYLTSETDSQTLTFNSPNLSISNGNTVDLSALLDDTDTNTFTSSATFNTTNGVITFTRNDSTTYTVNLDGRYSQTDTTYSQATSTTLGLVKIGYAENGKNYPVELSNGQMFVNVPWTDTNTDTDNYVDSVAFNTTNGILTIGRTGALSDLTVDLDGRYLTSFTDTNDIDYINSASFNTGDGVLTLSGVGNAGATVDLDGRYQQIGDAPTAHTHTFDSLTSKTSGTGEYSTSSHLTSGRGSGGVSLTINDGYGNANVTWNHKSGVPEQNGNAARIEVNTDSTTGATMYFELGSGVTSGQAINLNAAMTLTETSAAFPGTVTSNGNTLATESYVTTQVANLVDSAPGTLDTLNELAAALGDDPNFATTITNSIATKQDASTALTTSTQFGGDVSGTYGAIVVANDSHTHSNYMTNNAATQFNVGRGAVYVENNSYDNVDGAGITFRTSSNPGITTTSGGIFAVRSSGNGNRLWVGQGLTSSGANPFYVGGNSNVNTATGSANPANYAIEFATNGTITATGDVCAYGTISDRRQKENVLKLENALDKVNQLNGYTFNYIGKEDRMTGVMAQEVAEVLPEAVFETKAFGAEESTMAVRHGNMVGLLIEAIKELTEQNRQMAEEIKQLKNKP